MLFLKKVYLKFVSISYFQIISDFLSISFSHGYFNYSISKLWLRLIMFKLWNNFRIIDFDLANKTNQIYAIYFFLVRTQMKTMKNKLCFVNLFIDESVKFQNVKYFEHNTNQTTNE